MRPAVGHLRSSTIRIRTSRRSRFGPAAYRLYAVSSWPCAIQLVQIAIRTHDSRAHVWTECADCTGRHADGLLRLSSGGCPKSCAGALVRTTSTCRHTSDVTDGEREEVVGCRARGSHRADVFKPRCSYIHATENTDHAVRSRTSRCRAHSQRQRARGRHGGRAAWPVQPCPQRAAPRAAQAHGAAAGLPCPWLGPPWSLVPRSRCLGRARRDGRVCFSTKFIERYSTVKAYAMNRM